MMPHPSGPMVRNQLNQVIDEVLTGFSDPLPGRVQDEAVLAALPLAESIARRYRGRGVDQDDLLQVARLGLVKAVRGYRAGTPSGFTAYAVPTIVGEIKRHFRDHEWLVRPPRALQELQSEVSLKRTQLGQQFGRIATDDEVAEELGVSASRVRDATMSRRAYAATGTGSEELLQVAAVEDQYARVLDRAQLGDVLAGLSDRDAALFRMRFVEERSQGDIAAELGVSQVQVSRLLGRLLGRLRLLLSSAGERRAG